MTTHTITVADHGQVDITINDYGSGHPFLLLHGGAGPLSVAGFAQQLAAQKHARVYVPSHPGFAGTIRPDWLCSIGGLAEIYIDLLNQLDLSDVTVIGSSIGGWIAAEMAVRGSARISSFVLIDAVGIVVEGHPVADIFSLTMDEIAQMSYHNPAAFRRDPATMSDAEKRGMASNRAALAVYGGQPSMTDPTLAQRLGAITTPTLVLWGDSDGVVDLDYGRAYAAAIPTATFQLLANAGHLPQLETPDQTLAAVWNFAQTHAANRPNDG